MSNLLRQLDAVERDARKLVDGLTEDDAMRRPAPQAWSVAECLDHLAVSNRAYLRAMRSAAVEGAGRIDSPERDAHPGWIGRWMVWTLEPPVRSFLKTKAPAASLPRRSPGLRPAEEAFFRSHQDAVAFLWQSAEIDLRRARFANPFLPFLHLSFAAGLQILAAHERRHLWQAWRARTCAAEASSGAAQLCEP